MEGREIGIAGFTSLVSISSLRGPGNDLITDLKPMKERACISISGLTTICWWFVLFIALSISMVAPAATTGFTQTGSGPYNYSDTNNWLGGTINGLWDSSLVLAANQTITFSADMVLTTGLTFNQGGNFTVSLTSSSATTRTLTLGGDVVMTTASVNLGNSGNKLNVSLGGVTRGISIAGNTLDVFNAISNGAIFKSGSGTLRLETSNPFNGGLIIANGSTVAKNTGALGNNGSGTVYLGDTMGAANADLSLGVSGVFNNPLVVQAGNSGLAQLDNYVNYSPTWAGAITLNNDLTLSTAANGNSLTVSGKISGSGALNLSSGGSPIILTGTNTYSGPTYLLSGTLILNNKGSLTSPWLSLGGGAMLDVSGLSSTFVLGASQTLSNSSTATGLLKGSLRTSNGIVEVSFDGTTPVFTITNGTLTLSTNTVFRIHNTVPFAPGIYPLITLLSGGSVAGVVPAVTFKRGTGHLQISGGELDLVVDAVASGPQTFHVSPSGSDSSGDGSIGNPWQTVAKARDYLDANIYQTGEITVYLRGGRYELTNTLAFGTANSGENGYYITYRAYPGETPTISGGKRVTGWAPVPGQPCWVANVPTNAGFAGYFRQLYVNGVRAERARSDWLPATNYLLDPLNANTCNGVVFATNSGLKAYSNLSDLRLLHIVNFKIDEFPVTGMATNPVSGLLEARLQQPYCQARYSYSGGPPTNYTWRATDPWMVVNAFEELDEPGEWYLNRATRQLYYYPYSYENMSTAVAYAPVVETLVSLNGDSTSNKVQNIRFQGITFEHGNWFFPRDYYIGGCQAELLFNAAPTNGSIGYNYAVPGEIMLINTLGIQFLGNTIQHQGGCGIHTYDGARDTLVQGNIFYDLTGAAVLGGNWGDISELCTNTVIVDNLIRDIGMDFMAATLVDNLANNSFQVVHNDMADSQYMGFHERNTVILLPTDQGNVVVASNRIALVMGGARYGVCDGGSIYSFGVFPNSLVTANDIYDLNQPSAITGPVRGLYEDEYSYGWTWSSNVIRSVLPGLVGCGWVGKNTNYAKINVAIGNFTDATAVSTSGLASNISYTTFPLGQPPSAAQTIMAAAGLEPAYTNLLSRIYSGTNLALGKYAWASSTWGAGYAASNAVNWTYNNYWRSASNDTNSWWAVDLGAPYVIQRLEVAPRIDLDDPAARQDFQVQGANNSNFVGFAVLSEQNDTPFAYKAPNLRNSWIKYLNNPNGYRYLRVQKTSGWNLSFSEFQAYGYLVSTNTGRLVWDGGASGGVTDGSGEWNAPNQWWNGSWNQAWADYNDAVIGNTNGAAGLITVTGASPILNSLTFNAADSGVYIVSGNTLQLAGTTSPSVTANADAIVANNLVAAGTFLKNGTAMLTLAGSNTFAADVTVAAGILKAAHVVALGGTNNVVINTGATADINGQSLNSGTKAIVVGGDGVGGNGAIINTGGGQGSAFSNLVMTADTTIGTESQITLRNSFSTPGLGLDMGGHTLTKIGAGVLSLTTAASGCLTNPGNMVVNAGTLQFGFSFPNKTLAPGQSNCTVMVKGGAILDIYKSSANMTYNLVMQDRATLSFSGYSNTGSLNGPMIIGGTVAFLMNTNGFYQGHITGTGSLLKTGLGTLTLIGTNDYAGNTTLSNGTLVIQQPGLATNAIVVVATGAKLQLNFTGTNQVGGLSFNGTNQPAGVHNSSTDPAFLAGPGSLLAAASIPTIPTNLFWSVGNNSLTLSWPSNYLGWVLQAQTNTLTMGLNNASNAWFDQPGTAAVNSTNLLIAATNPAVFYRLRHP